MMRRQWKDGRSGRTWAVVRAPQARSPRTSNDLPDLIWFAREREFWSTECYAPGGVQDLSDAQLQEHLDRAMEGWDQRAEDYVRSRSRTGRTTAQ